MLRQDSIPMDDPPDGTPQPTETPDTQKRSVIQRNPLLLSASATWGKVQVAYYLQESYSPDRFQTAHPWSRALAISVLQWGPLRTTSKRFGSVSMWEVLQSVQISRGREPLLKDHMEGSYIGCAHSLCIQMNKNAVCGQKVLHIWTCSFKN